MRRAWWLALLIALPAMANELMVDTRTVQMNDLVTITISLEGEFASAEGVEIPLVNLALVGEPWVSSEFAWVNGDVVRRKVFRYRARPLAPGAARVGPIVLNSGDGQRETLAAIAIDVQPDRTTASNDAETVLRELLASGRDPLFVIAEVEKPSVFVGEPLTITWFLYNAATVQQWQVVSVPKLDDFWTDEIAIKGESPERIYIGDAMVQRLPIRRVTLYPLRSGRLHVGGMAVEASIMRRMRAGPFAMFEGEVVETTFTSAPLDIDVKPVPPGPPVDAVGDLTLSCDAPVQRNAGPVVVGVALSGRGNLRSASAPRFGGRVAGDVEIEGGEVSETTRRWRYLIFPSASGPLEIPPVTMRVFVPATGQRRELQCEERILQAVVQRTASPRSPNTPDAPEPRSARWPWLLLLLVLVPVPFVQRELALRRETRALLRDPAQIRARIDERFRIDIREQSERGDAYRALRSLLDAAEHERDIAANADAELARRVRELLRITR